MKFFKIENNVGNGQCKNALVRIQFKDKAFYIGNGVIRGWAGTRIGIFSPVIKSDGYHYTGFYFRPWLAPDIAVNRLPKCYVSIMNAISFKFNY